jgi:hypothetical protein
VYGKSSGQQPCKLGLRLKFSKHHKFEWDEDAGPLFRFPSNQRWCSKVTKLLLRNEYEDPALMVRNKLTQDLFKHAGMATPRIEYATVSLNGVYFGLYTLNEEIDSSFARCNGWPSSGQDALMFKARPDDLLGKGEQHGDWSGCDSDAPAHCALGFERKMPSCSDCENDFTTAASPKLLDSPSQCGCPNPVRLAELFNAVTDPSATKQTLEPVLNLTSYMLWEIVTTFVVNQDTGWHNYYLYSAGRDAPFHVINYDADQGWGRNTWSFKPQMGSLFDDALFGCSCSTTPGMVPLGLIFMLAIPAALLVARRQKMQQQSAGGGGGGSDRGGAICGDCQVRHRLVVGIGSCLMFAAMLLLYVPLLAAVLSSWAVGVHLALAADLVSDPKSNDAQSRPNAQLAIPLVPMSPATAGSADSNFTVPSQEEADEHGGDTPPPAQLRLQPRLKALAMRWHRGALSLLSVVVGLHFLHHVNALWSTLLVLALAMPFIACTCGCIAAEPCGASCCGSADSDHRIEMVQGTACRQRKCNLWCSYFYIILPVLCVFWSGVLLALADQCHDACKTTDFYVPNYVPAIGAAMGGVGQKMVVTKDRLLMPEYYALYSQFLSLPAVQPCALRGAITALAGEGGVIRKALETEHEAWGIYADLDYELNVMLRWAAERGDLVNAAVQAKLDELGRKDAQLPPQSCMQSCPAGHRCVQGSLERTCVRSVVGADACGCVGSSGWASSTGVCAEGATTSDAEAMACGAGFPEGI